jgi:hypothetical protein
MKTRPKMFAASILAAALFSLGAVSTHAEDSPIASDDFQSGKKLWDWYGDVEGGQLTLTALADTQWAGTQTLLKPVLQIGATNQDALHIHFVINGLTAGSAGVAEGRLFLVPSPLSNPTFADPTESNSLSIIVSANAANGTFVISLCQRVPDDEAGSCGTRLFTTTLPADSFPLAVDWYLSQKGYKLSFGKAGGAVDGSGLKSWELGAPWNGELRFAMRVINASAGVKSQLRIGNFSAASGPIPQ